MKLHTLLIVALLALVLNFMPANAHAQDACPAIPADGPGVQRIDGQGSYSFWGIPAIIVDQPVVAMVDDSLAAQGVQDAFPDPNGQVLGMITSDFFTSPFSFTINLPAEGLGAQVDVDQDSEADAGVQIYQVVLAQNLLNTVPLVGIAQGPILSSYYRDAVTDEIVAGAVVLYAPDDQQGFPCGYGADGKLFTEDDPIAALPSGFTVANIADGAITFDRSEVAHVATFEAPSGANPDFSDQGIVESFNTLIDFLRKRYVFNNFAGVNDVDWDALYDTYLPRVEKAEANEDLGEYGLAMVDLAHEIADAHVYVYLDPLAADPKALQTILAGIAGGKGGIGADVVELDDGRIIVTSVKSNSPAEAAGFTFGTQIVAVDGLAVADALAQPVNFNLKFPGTAESTRVLAVQYLVKRPPGTDLEIAYQLPDSSEVMTTTLTAVANISSQPESAAMPMEYRLMDGIGYVTWKSFGRTGIATHIFADFIKVMGQQQIPGIIIDVRGNGGGSALMEFAILSYLYSQEKPLSFGIADSYSYNVLTDEFVREPKTMELSAPPTAQPYLGDVVVLVDQDCVSACEFMNYWLQASGRATVVGQYATEGGGGNVNAITMPGGFTFSYTAGTDVNNETDQPIFQAVGVIPDVRVPVTEETEQLKREGGDPVLDAGIDHLRRLAFERLGHEPATFAGGAVTSTVPSGWKPNADGSQYTSPDKHISLSIIAWTESAETDPDTIMAAAYPEIEKGGEIETDLGTWSIYGSEVNDTFNVYGVIVIDGQPYIVTSTTNDERLIPLMAEFILAPALHDFTVVESAVPAAAAPANERVTLAIELTTNPWLWTSFSDPMEEFAVETPENYTITFNTDGTVNIKADCNNARGSYTADDNGSLAIKIGPMTRALCPPGSRSDEFVQKLGFVANFFFENGFLYLDTMADGGTFQLASAAEHMPSADAATESTAAEGLTILETLIAQNDELSAPAAGCMMALTYPVPDPAESVKRPLDFSPFSEALAGFSAEEAAIDTAIQGKTVLELQELLDSGELTSEQLVLYYLDRIQRYDENLLNSIMELNPAALTTAQELDAARADTTHGPLYGIPVTLKDNIATVGPMHTTAGNYALKDWQADRDSFLVTQLRDAGAIILGKNNLSEWANYTDPCLPSGFSALGGQTRNANGAFDTLGSSSGSAVAVDANLTTVSVGSETAGSLVNPGRINGVVSMRPSKGLVSGDYIIPLEPTLDTAGPMGRSVTDVAVLLTTLAATDPNEPRGADAAALADVDFTDYLSLDEARKLRVGVVRLDTLATTVVPTFADLPVEVQEQLMDLVAQLPNLSGYNAPTSAMIDALESQGIEVVIFKQSEFPADLSNAHTGLVDYGFQAGIAELFGSMDPPAPIRSLADVVTIVNEDPAARAPYGQRYVEASAATGVTAEEYEAAVAEARQRAEAWLEAVYAENAIDVLMPGILYTTGGAAGAPAISIPTGPKIDSDTGEPTGEPAGVIITGPYLSDAHLIAVGYALEQALGGYVAPDLDATIAEIEAVTGQ